MSQLANFSGLRCRMVASIQHFQFECRLLFECCTQGSSEPKLSRISNCCIEDCVVTHRIHTTDLVP